MNSLNNIHAFHLTMANKNAFIFVNKAANITSITVTQIIETLIQKYNVSEVLYTVKEMPVRSKNPEQLSYELNTKNTVEEVREQIEEIFMRCVTCQ